MLTLLLHFVPFSLSLVFEDLSCSYLVFGRIAVSLLFSSDVHVRYLLGTPSLS